MGCRVHDFIFLCDKMTRSQTDQSLNLYTSEHIKRSRNSKSTQFKVETDTPDGGKLSQTCLLIWFLPLWIRGIKNTINMESSSDKSFLLCTPRQADTQQQQKYLLKIWKPLRLFNVHISMWWVLSLWFLQMIMIFTY